MKRRSFFLTTISLFGFAAISKAMEIEQQIEQLSDEITFVHKFRTPEEAESYFGKRKYKELSLLRNNFLNSGELASVVQKPFKSSSDEKFEIYVYLNFKNKDSKLNYLKLREKIVGTV